MIVTESRKGVPIELNLCGIASTDPPRRECHPMRRGLPVHAGIASSTSW
jgi:hypothetical protein